MHKIKNILLIKPYRYVTTLLTLKEIPFPLGLGYLAAVLEKNYNVIAIDIDLEELSEAELVKRIEDFKPDLVGISSMFSVNYKYAHDTARIIKSISQEIVVVMGGVHVTSLPQEVLRDKNVDFAIVGEGEISFLQLVECLNDKGELRSIDGIAFRENGGVCLSSKRSIINNLNELPFPARHIFPFERYTRTARKYYTRPRQFPFTHMITSRGCPYDCTFCAVRKITGRRYRVRSAENVILEVKYLVENYNIKEIHFYDDNITLYRDRFLRILEGLKIYKINWVPLNFSVNGLNEELLEKIKESGCYRIVLSIESGTERVLKRIMNKNVDLQEVRKIVKFARQLDIEVIGVFVIGMPGETLGEIYKTVNFAEELDLDYFIFSIATPYPGTRLFDICKDCGFLIPEFSLEKLRISQGCIKTPEFCPDDLERIRHEEWARILFSSERRVQRLMRITGMNRQEIELWRRGEENLYSVT